MVATSAHLDTLYEIETPEGIHLQLRIAGVFARAIACVVDGLLRGLLYICVGLSLLLFSVVGLEGLWLVIIFLLEWFFPVYFEVYHQGQTPGKKMMGLVVVKEDGAPVDWGSSLTRNLLRIVDVLPLAYFFGVLASLYSPRFQRLGDMAAGTLVVYRPKIPAKLRDAQSASVTQQQEGLAPPCLLSAAEQRLLMDYTRRCAQLSAERQAELVSVLPLSFVQTSELSWSTPPDHAALQVQRYGHWLIGGAG